MLRQVKKLEQVYIIALTSWNDSKSRALTTRAGFDLHLAKPVRMPELLAALEMGCQAYDHLSRAREAGANVAGAAAVPAA